MHLQLLFLHRLVVFMMMMMKMEKLLQCCCFYYVLLCCAVKSNKFNVWWYKVYSVYASEHVAFSFIMCGTHYFFISTKNKNKKRKKTFSCFCSVHEINFFFSKALQRGEGKKNLVIAFPSHISYNGLLITTRHV